MLSSDEGPKLETLDLAFYIGRKLTLYISICSFLTYFVWEIVWNFSQVKTLTASHYSAIKG